jgi:hypothetical protein
MASATVFLFLGFLYFLPLFVAASRKHNNTTAIGVLNLLLGWTIAGWIAALIWSATDNVQKVAIQQR